MTYRTDEMKDALDLRERLASDLECVKGTIELVENTVWLKQAPVLPHLEGAAQGVFVALSRLDQACAARYGQDVWDSETKEQK